MRHLSHSHSIITGYLRFQTLIFPGYPPIYPQNNHMILQACISETALSRTSLTKAFKVFPSRKAPVTSISWRDGSSRRLKAPFERFFRFFADFSACLEIVINGRLEILLKLRHRRAFKTYDIIDAQDMPVKDTIFGVKLNGPDVLLVFQIVFAHGFTPMIFKKSLTFSTAYFFMSPLGCGLWIFRTRLLKTTETRDPSPSKISDPIALKRDSTFRHEIIDQQFIVRLVLKQMPIPDGWRF